jgi:branched-chain amino acid transport system permease protein
MWGTCSLHTTLFLIYTTIESVVLMDSVVIIWLLLAGPLWAAIGGYLIPRAYGKERLYEPLDQLAGILGGFAAGPLAVGLLAWRTPALTERWIVGTSILSLISVSQVMARLEPETLVTAWLLLAGPAWALVGAIAIPRRYRNQGLDESQTRLVGALGGFTLGPLIIGHLWSDTPPIARRAAISLSLLTALVLGKLFVLLDPNNLCAVNQTYVAQQLVNGLTIGILYALMATGLTLIYSIQGVVSFAHGQSYMIGGYFSYYFLIIANDFLQQTLGLEGVTVNPIWGIPVAGLMTLMIGLLFERYFLRPMHTGHIERAGEYAILITFGFGFFLEYTTLAGVGPFSQRADAYMSARSVRLPELAIGETQFLGQLTLLPNRLVATMAGILLIGLLLLFLQRTWTGRALRAVSMDKQAAAVSGINPLRMNTLAFGMGTMLAGMSGAALIPIFSWVPWVGAAAATRSYVIVVLGGLGSIPGALLGGGIVGIVESIGAGCWSDPSKGAAYKEAFGLVIFAIVLLLKPTGLFGRRL